MTVMEAIRARRSIRKYQDRPVEEEKLQQVLEAGRLAPSARNQQQWHFIAVTDKQLREKLPEACCGQTFVREAPVVLVVTMTAEPRAMACGQLAQPMDCSIALSFMMLEAVEQGLGCCWLGAFYADQVKAVLQLPENETGVAVAPMGYPEGEVAARPRKSAEEVISRR
ncbi:nitroreductase family protein [Angelakisella massiliensis]|uniref:nitroreductase family protein n=1 Tax=Angelakisella massiliensis TaxID=1871018 RepID=UPI0023A8B70F|nr:nitroreductase family protein [Angelakisella massiliensis]